MSEQVRYLFRELCSATDLRASFALRYQVYSRTAGVCRLGSLDQTSGLDVEGFDRYSRHFGVFEESGEAATLIGGLRVTGGEPTPYVQFMREAVAGDSTALSRLESRPGGALPAMTYSVERERLASAIRAMTARGEDVSEAGRLVMLPGVRRSGARGVLRLARAAVAAVAAQFFLVGGVANGIVNCHCRHRSFYAPFGFRELDGPVGHFEVCLDGIPLSLLHGRPEWLAGETRSLCERLADELNSAGRAVLFDSIVPTAGR